MFGVCDFRSGPRVTRLLPIGALLQMTAAIRPEFLGSRSILGDPRWLGPAAAAQRTISSAVHARYQPHANNDGTGSQEYHIAIEDDGPKGTQQQEALPRIPGAPC